MDLNAYYRKNRDDINSSVMEIASELAVARLCHRHGQPFEAFVEQDGDTPEDSGTCYKDEFQDEYNRLYDEAYEQLAALMKFDVTSPDGTRES